MKNFLSKVDWFQVCVLTLGIAASFTKSIYESKRFDDNLDKRYDDNLDKRVSEIVDKKLKEIR